MDSASFSLKFSFIIPHYNHPDLLIRCLKSIPQRKDIQVIVVDDCSPDAATYLERYPELRRPGLELYSTPKGGSAGRARNIGLEHAQGQWCLFADADDYYVEGFLDIIEQNLSDNLDILYFNISGNERRANTHRKIFDLYLSQNDDTQVRYRIWTPWNKVIAHQFILDNHLRFEEVPVGNDAMFGLNASFQAKQYRIIEDQLYCLTDNNSSLSFQKQTFEREFAYTKVRTRITKFLTPLGLQYRDGYCLFSISRAKRIAQQYGIINCLKFVGYVACHYGLIHALLYNRKRKKYQQQHPEYIYCY